MNIEKEGSGKMVTVALIVSRSVTRSMRRPRDACPREELVLGAGHCIRLGFVASTVQGWEGKRGRRQGRGDSICMYTITQTLQMPYSNAIKIVLKKLAVIASTLFVKIERGASTNAFIFANTKDGHIQQ